MSENTAPVPSNNQLQLHKDVAELTIDLINIPSVSDDEGPIANAVEQSLRALGHLEVHRFGDAVVARTNLGRAERVILAGHLDTVPLPHAEGARGSVPAQLEGDVLYGRGSVDMKGGVAVQLALAGALEEPNRDITFIFYDHEEVEAYKSGIARILEHAPELLTGDLAILLEPTHGTVEGGCNGTIRLEVRAAGKAAHAARGWMGSNAIHALAPVLNVLHDFEPATVEVEALEFRESMNAVLISGGTAGNVIPDEAVIELNYRFAPDKDLDAAETYVREVLGSAVDGVELVRTDGANGAKPGLDKPAALSFVQAVGQQPQPKYGWTDVSRFSALGIPALNFGPGDSLLAHSDDEHVSCAAVRACFEHMRAWLA